MRRGVGLLGKVGVRSKVGLLSLAAGLLALPLGAQERALENRVPPEVLAAVQPVLESARLDSLPILALEAKVLEGVAKGVPADRIGSALRTLAGDFRSSRSALRSALPAIPLADGEVVSAALAMRQGVPAEALVSLWESRPNSESLEIPLAVTGELARRGVEPSEAVGVMNHILASRTPLSTAAQIPGRLDVHLPGSGAPGAALRRALQSLGIPDPPGRGPGGPPGRRRGGVGARPPGG